MGIRILLKYESVIFSMISSDIALIQVVGCFTPWVSQMELLTAELTDFCLLMLVVLLLLEQISFMVNYGKPLR